MTQTKIPALVIRRIYDAAPERIYAAWTDPSIAKHFLGPGEVRAEEVQMDVRTGGTYRIAMRRPQGDVWTVAGEYREVVPNRRLSMTWRWLEDDPADEHDTLLTLEFNPSGTGTELVLTHDYFATEESRSGHGDGWNATLLQLSELMQNV